jgi:hypothetical protein
MIRDTIAAIEARIRAGETIGDDRRAELLSLLSALRDEVDRLSETRAEHAESITGFVNVSTHEAMRRDKDPRLLQLSLDGLSSSVEGFEMSHPRLVESVNRICMMLSNLGI